MRLSTLFSHLLLQLMHGVLRHDIVLFLGPLAKRWSSCWDKYYDAWIKPQVATDDETGLPALMPTCTF